MSPRRNQSSSWTTDLKWTRLVVSRGKLVAQVEARLRAEDRARADAGAVGAGRAVVEHEPEQVECIASMRAKFRRRRPSMQEQAVRVQDREQITRSTQDGERPQRACRNRLLLHLEPGTFLDRGSLRPERLR